MIEVMAGGEVIMHDYQPTAHSHYAQLGLAGQQGPLSSQEPAAAAAAAARARASAHHLMAITPCP